jgi:5-methylcytosine-specific restriction protein A
MPSKPLRTCSTPGCPNLTPKGKCDTCKAKRGTDGPRAPWHAQSHRWYASARWREARQRFLVAHPLCVQCEQAGRVVPATVVDHIVPHRGNPERFWDVLNWRSLCVSHHNAKSANE